MNNFSRALIFLLLCASIALALEDKKWYSPINREDIANKSLQFLESLKTKNAQLFTDLISFRGALVNRSIDVLYDYRTASYHKIVSRAVFEETIHLKSNTPEAVYYSLKSSIINEETAEIHSYYVQDTPEFKYVVESIDKWKFDKTQNKWLFISSSLSWGSPFGEDLK